MNSDQHGLDIGKVATPLIDSIRKIREYKMFSPFMLYTCCQVLIMDYI